MNLIKKEILFISGKTYNFNILLTADIKDLGFFDTLDNTDVVGQITEDYAQHLVYVTGSTVTGTTTGLTFNYPSTNYDFSNYTPDTASTFTYLVTGDSISRLVELEKFVVSTDPNIKYFQYTGGTDGLSGFTINSSLSAFTYFVGGIRYSDLTLSGSTATTTTFSFSATTNNPLNFDNKRIIKYESKQNMIENPQVGKDVFILRQEQPVFERNYRLRSINALNDVLIYAGGNYFNIINNT